MTLTLQTMEQESAAAEFEALVNKRRLKLMSYALKAHLKQATRQKRIVSGMKSCGQLLNENPASVMLCILPHSQKLGDHIHQMLIQAFCRENSIMVLAVDDAAKLASFVEELKKQGRKKDRLEQMDASCVLVQFPKGGCRRQEELQLVKLYEEFVESSHSMPHLDLPD